MSDTVVNVNIETEDDISEDDVIVNVKILSWKERAPYEVPETIVADGTREIDEDVSIFKPVDYRVPEDGDFYVYWSTHRLGHQTTGNIVVVDACMHDGTNPRLIVEPCESDWRDEVPYEVPETIDIGGSTFKPVDYRKPEKSDRWLSYSNGSMPTIDNKVKGPGFTLNHTKVLILEEVMGDGSQTPTGASENDN